MKTAAIITYLIGSILLILSCLTVSATATWCLSGISMAILLTGCIFQFAGSRNAVYAPSVIRVQSQRIHKHQS
ncbi:MAG: hypothetical protein K2G53_09095 [Muribaculaceae bacterium]|nr:hypothetical protein [Bacteroides sp.]MDE6072689.1 hypothetical protein [Muribaculaceae bacterium]